MKEQRIEIEIDEHGRLKADAHGFTGDTCLKELEKLLADCRGVWVSVTRKQPDRQASTSTSTNAQLKTGGR
ncbi:MAG: hypothetical protein ACK4PI_07385 [Tepidisphaerales bacterium]